MTEKLELWTSATPNGWKITIMLEELRELDVPLPHVAVKPVDIMNGEQFGEAFSAVAPNQKIPALVHGDLRLMESCAILQYLGETFPSSLYPSPPARYEVLQWLTWQAAGLGPTFGNKLSYTRYLPEVPEAEKRHPLQRFEQEAQRLLRVMDRRLSDRPFLAGDSLTIADIACFPWIRGYKWSKIDITSHSHVMAWKSRVEARPGVQRGVRYGMPEDEGDRWSSATRARYAAGGSFMAANQTLLKGAR